MNDRMRSERFDLILAEAYRRTIRICGGEIWEANGVVSWACSLPGATPVHANGVMRLNRQMSGRQVLGITAGFFQVRGNANAVMARADDRALIAELEQAGWTMVQEHRALLLCESSSGMESAVDIRQVKDPSGMLDFCATVVAGWGADSGIRPFANLLLRRREVFTGSAGAALLAYDQGDPVASALMMIIDGVVFVDWVSTRPEYLRRGLAASTVVAAIRVGFDRGASMAVTLSPVSLLPMFSCLGFREVGRYLEYGFPQPA